MMRTVIVYAFALAAAVGALEWLEYRYVTRVFSTEIYIVLIAVAASSASASGWGAS